MRRPLSGRTPAAPTHPPIRDDHDIAAWFAPNGLRDPYITVEYWPDGRVAFTAWTAAGSHRYVTPDRWRVWALREAQSWADEQAGVTVWVESPFGGWQSAETMRRFAEERA